MPAGEELTLIVDGHEVYVGVVYFESDDGLRHFAAGEGLFDGGGHFLGEDLHAGYVGVAEVEEVVGFLLWNYEGVAALDGVDVEEGVELAVFGAL